MGLHPGVGTNLHARMDDEWHRTQHYQPNIYFIQLIQQNIQDKSRGLPYWFNSNPQVITLDTVSFYGVNVSS